jgi:hypothetical protein
MIMRSAGVVATVLALASCSSGGNNPLQTPPASDGGTTDPATTILPGTQNPTAAGAIQRLEAKGTSGQTGYGNVFANGFTHNSSNDTFTVQGLPFDGNQPSGTVFSRSTSPATLATNFALYESPTAVPDFGTGSNVAQNMHRALYAISASGNTEFAIVRTGAYSDYGFGGFMYQRKNGVTLPTTGQASYSGDYAGIQDANGSGGLRYVDGTMSINIDYGGFSGNCASGSGACENAVSGTITNRRVFNSSGTDITASVITALDTDNSSVSITQLPVLQFKIGPDVMDNNGEITGEVHSSLPDGTALESGKYYAVMSGDHSSASGGEIVGIVVSEFSTSSIANGGTVRETGGFIVTRN